jgi:NAD(P)-dependent dehydrogenase (short-subunit alcohol dehydrogenase family)
MVAPRVSVVLPVWNGERFLVRAIESVLSQTFTSLELLVIDDGSTDETAAIARGFAARDARVVVVTREHGGVAQALNAGIAAARGQYIARMDADDVSFPSRLQRQIEFLDARPDCVAVGTAVEIIDEIGEHVGTKTFAETHDEIESELIGGTSAIAHPTVLARRDALVAVGGYELDRYPSEDYDLWIRLVEKGQLANLREPLLAYRRHRGAIGVRHHDWQMSMGAMINSRARASRGLRPLAVRPPSTRTNHVARYHLDCARIALFGGPRAAAIRHARASILFEPLWLEAYAALVACAVPKPALRLIARLWRALDRTTIRA